MKKICLPLALVAMLACSSANADLIAYWNQDFNQLPNGGFGLQPSDFPQAANIGSGSLSINGDLSTTISGGGDTVFEYWESFGGNPGGSLAVQGGLPDMMGGFSNNGASIVIAASTVGFSDVLVSWDQRGTSTGFSSRTFEYSIDGGMNWIFVAEDTGALSSSWETEAYDLSGVAELNNNSGAAFRITVNGASGTTGSGNNRFDNIRIAEVPEPAACVVLAISSLALIRRRR